MSQQDGLDNRDWLVKAVKDAAAEGSPAPDHLRRRLLTSIDAKVEADQGPARGLAVLELISYGLSETANRFEETAGPQALTGSLRLLASALSVSDIKGLASDLRQRQPDRITLTLPVVGSIRIA